MEEITKIAAIPFKPLLSKVKFGRKTPIKKVPPKPRMNADQMRSPASSGHIHFNKKTDMTNDAIREEKEGFGMGSQIGLGAIGMVPFKGKAMKEKASTGLARMRIKAKDAEQNISSKVKDKIKLKQGGFLDNSTKITKQIKVGEEVGPNGVKMPINRQVERDAIISAPIKKVTDFAVPIMGYTYLEDKVLGDGSKGDKQNIENPNTPQPNYDENNNVHFKTASLVQELEKKAALDKVAALESELKDVNGLLKYAQTKNDILIKDAGEMFEEISTYKNDIHDLEKELKEKEEEIKRITEERNNQERDEKVETIANNLLERGIIKQVDFKETLAQLKVCDDTTFKMYEKLAFSDALEKGLEKDVYMLEYIHKQSSNISDHISKIGETIGEAARDLIKK